MKKILSSTKMLAALLMAGAAFTACSEKDEIVAEQSDVVRTYKMVVNASIGDDTKTRALYFDNTSLKAKWANTDQVSVFPAAWSRTAYGTLTAAASDNGSTTLTGNLTTLPTAGDHLNLLFPRATWDYTGQKGVLLSDANSIEKKYDYAVADVEVNSVTGYEIATTTANFQNQQAIVKFTLQDNGGNAINATSLKVSASSNKLVKNKSYRGAGTKTYYYGNGYYTVTAGSGGFNNEQHGNLVDNNLGTKWCANKPDGNWYIEFQTASAIQVDGYMLRTGGDTQSGGNSGRNPKNWVLYGKKDSGDSWSVIDSKTDNYDMPIADNAETDFDADAPGQYKFFRLEISAVRSGSSMQMSEMRLFSYEYFELGTTYGGLTVTPANATNEMTVALRNENASADTYTLTATVGGATYSFSQSDVTFENGKYYAITVKMNPKKVSSISLNKTSASLLIGGTVELSVSNVSPSDAVDKTVTWSSSNTSVATVNASTGVVTAKAAGSATITATANDGSGKTATCSVTVYPAGTIAWDSSNCSSLYIDGRDSYHDNTTIAGVNLKCNANNVDAGWYGGIAFHANATGGFTFTAPTGKTFTKIEMMAMDSNGWGDAIENGSLGTGWPSGYEAAMAFRSSKKITWTGNVSTVNLLTGVDDFNGSVITSIVFFVSE